MRIILLALAALAAITALPAQASGLAALAALPPKMSCASLASADLGSAVGAAVSGLVASEVAGDKPYCKVTGTIAPKIGFEVRLPMQGWTQRFLQTGCGGLCGGTSIRAGLARDCLPVTDGAIALASTDMGHQGMDMAWGSNPQQREDFAHRGVHLTALAAKALITAFYGQAPRFSYFSGCSDGGREALIAAQRYPADYDGIAAGAPALNFTVQNSFYHAWMALSNQGPDGQALLNAADMPVLRNAAIKACDARDGLQDGQITDPRQCRFDPGVTLCKAAYQPGQCLTAPQVAAARKLYAGPRDEKGRRLTLGGPVPGSEMEWPGVFVPAKTGGMIFSEKIALDTINHLLWTPNPSSPVSLAGFAFTSANFNSMAAARRLYNADAPDLTRFAAQGGRLILWHGWNDQHIAPVNTIDYFTRAGAAMGTKQRDAMLRLFMIPAMGHCRGSDGPNDFPLLAALMAWVEGGDAPQMMIATRTTPDANGLPPRSRPVYAYPAVARYTGRGSVDDAASFAPVASKPSPPVRWIGSGQ